MANLFNFVARQISDDISGIIVALMISTITGFALFLRERHEWKDGKFGQRVNISLNIFTGSVLRIRTVHEDTMKDFFLSSYARKLLNKAARKTTGSDPFLHFHNERDAWLVYNDIINAISSAYSGHLLEATARGALKEATFLIAITWERNEEVRIQKYRVLMVQRDALKKLAKQSKGPILEMPHHRARIAALKAMHARWQKGSWPQYQIVSIPYV